MTALEPFESAAHLFRDFQHTAWRLETRRGYASDRNSPNWEPSRRGADFTFAPDNPWHRNVRAQIRQGKRFERVRLVDDPPTEGQRFLLATGAGNVAAGEDIRNLWRADAERLALPAADFWLFDSRVLVRFVFDDQDVTLGVQVTEDPAAVVHACQVRDAAWHHAIPTATFRAAVPSAR
ncbi:hypothetical protein QNO07_22260 [Streptomyces sp. 549]|uniref:DUF6879 family protein n=1 Tax=Streptomyces sp. 549 TaxID=3049076 RepID=UPI0024C44C03|nr:DUF6879 family protein [Streptomyces sp. 549]MDK1476110.1 hypothetical protein [Streptomyces sp. 549]